MRQPGTAEVLPCLTRRGAACELLVQVVPNAARTACAGVHDGALRVRLSAPPIDGRANLALLRWLAESLGLPRRAVTLLRGQTTRRKQVHLECDVAIVAVWLARELAAPDTR